MKAAIEREIRRRARGACEYCRMPEAAEPIPFQVDHVVARQHGGPTRIDNLALACPHCNRHKGPNVSGADPSTGRIVRLYHPRRNRWSRHFAWDGPELIGLTDKGRATIATLAMNDPVRVDLRLRLIRSGGFPPPPPEPKTRRKPPA